MEGRVIRLLEMNRLYSDYWDEMICIRARIKVSFRRGRKWSYVRDVSIGCLGHGSIIVYGSLSSFIIHAEKRLQFFLCG